MKPFHIEIGRCVDGAPAVVILPGPEPDLFTREVMLFSFKSRSEFKAVFALARRLLKKREAEFECKNGQRFQIELPPSARTGYDFFTGGQVEHQFAERSQKKRPGLTAADIKKIHEVWGKYLQVGGL